ncbi:LOW QUALITY PROTEIN: ubiquitin carboxyl-terminal hydrolase 32, partial [Cydia fagiglandana]|uniref:LOW QUALITY PROTEIN: ubiquitin carboxyl-terminal hydrolase 32 n=1 Tax=Cydia fagiglandana TaxID=1458189 RepID=UPI002FEE20FD
MGAKDSKPCFISYEDAVKRVSDSELRRIREAFKRCAGANGTSLSLEAFVREVLSDGVPYEVADWLYQACGGTKRGIAFKELLCGIVVLTKGNIEEKIKFLWTLYVNNQGDNGTYIYKWDFASALHMENISLPFTGAHRSAEILTSLFGPNDKVTFEQFRSWLLIHKDATVLSKWLLSGKANAVQELDTPTFYQSLAGVTHLEERDIIELEKCFWSLRNSAPTGQLDIESLAPLLSHPLPKAAVAGVFLAFDENRDGHVDFKELCCGLSAACRGPRTERLKFCFKIFDLDRDGVLNKKELVDMADILCTVANEHLRNQSSRASTPSDDDGDKGFDPEVALYLSLSVCFKIFDLDRDGVLNKKELVDMADILCTVANEHLRNQSSRASTPSDDDGDKGFDPEVVLLNLRDKLVTSVPKNGKKPVFQLGPGDGVDASKQIQDKTENKIDTMDLIAVDTALTQEDFLIWAVESADNLVAPFLQLLFEVCHIVLGLRPQCKHQERDIVLGWLRRSVQRGYSVGQFWYLVAAEWWGAWAAHTAGDGPCCRARPDDVICDESFTTTSTESMGSLLWRADTASLGSASSGVGSAGARPRAPGPIDNRRLLAPNPLKVRTLTGEGGHLRKDVTLAQHRDFELVPDALWRALALWYGGAEPLPRQVIRPPNSDVELELYPLNLKILRHVAVPQRMNSVSAVGGVSMYSSVPMAPPAPPAPPERQLAYTAAFSRLATVKQVSEFLCQALGLQREDVRLWSLGTNAVLLDDENWTLAELRCDERTRLLLEVRNADLTWPEEIGALSMSGGNRAMERRETLIPPNLPGATGLHNLGNTCYMNAALQSVWNTGPLTRYFNSGIHLYEVNTANPLGTKGALAVRYGELCKEVWSCSARSVAPLRVRWCVSRHARALAGGGQHDAQELLAWLLDTLHEDLNRAAAKPLPIRDSDGRPDQEVAAEAWAAYAARNASIVTDLFYGQLKSRVRCDVCSAESTRFDAFNMLSLPLPVEQSLRAQVIVMLLDGSVPIKYGVLVNSEGTYLDLKKKLSELCGLAPESMMIVELNGATIGRILDDNAKIFAATALELYAYETPRETGEEECCCDHQQGNRLASGGSYSIVIRLRIASLRGHGARVVRQIFAATALELYAYETPRETGEEECCCDHQQEYTDAEAAATARAEVSARAPNTSSLCMPALFCFKRSKSEILMSQSPPNTFYKYSDNEDYRTLPKRDKNGNSSPTLSVKSLNLKASPRLGKVKFGSSPSNMNKMNETQESPAPRRIQYLVAVHRKQTRMDAYFLPAQRSKPALFGVPLLVGVAHGMSGRSVYAQVWTQVARLLSARPLDASNHATDCDDSLGYEFPFTLRLVSGSGAWCALCPWPALCRGCALPSDDAPLCTYGELHYSSRSRCGSCPAAARGVRSVRGPRCAAAALYPATTRLYVPTVSYTTVPGHVAARVRQRRVVCALSVARAVPRLRSTQRRRAFMYLRGAWCALCPWPALCRGCALPSDDAPLCTYGELHYSSRSRCGSCPAAARGVRSVRGPRCAAAALYPATTRLYVPTFPVTLRLVSGSGAWCALCPWPALCRGCALPSDDAPLCTYVPGHVAARVRQRRVVCALSVARAVPRLRSTQRRRAFMYLRGAWCALCPWPALCRGCALPSDDAPLCTYGELHYSSRSRCGSCPAAARGVRSVRGPRCAAAALYPATTRLYVPTFPVTLRLVSGSGAWCALCPWPALCRGCALPSDDAPLCTYGNNACPQRCAQQPHIDADTPDTSSPIARAKLRQNTARVGEDQESCEGSLTRLDFSLLRQLRGRRGAQLAIDWDPTALHLRYQSTREKAWVIHPSVSESSALAARPVDLASCLRAFTSHERLEQRYHCARCRAAQPATKVLQIWRLPPILIVHLKRFQYVNNKWIKSQKVVNFPFQDFDPSPYLASVPQETIARHMEINNIYRRRSSMFVDVEDAISESESETESEVEEAEPATPTVKSKDPPKLRVKINKRRESCEVRRRERLESTSLLATPVTDDNLVDYHQHHLSEHQDPFQLKYRLYAVVSHSGQMSGGHYVAYARNPSGTWLCYNDSMCRELGPSPPIDPASAYLLFYERQGLDYERYAHRPTLNPSGTWLCYNDSMFRELGSSPPIDPASAYLLFYERQGLDYERYAHSPTLNPSGTWLCYNDSMCRELGPSPPIDPASAYLLFYERQGLDYERYAHRPTLNPSGTWLCYNDSMFRELGSSPPIDPASAYLLFYERQGLDYERYAHSPTLNPSGTWLCYNDSMCRELGPSPPIDPASAYLLFYERQGLDYERYAHRPTLNPSGTWLCYNDSMFRELGSSPPIDPASAYLLFYERQGLDYERYAHSP